MAVASVIVLFSYYSITSFRGVNGRLLGREISFSEVYDMPTDNIARLSITNSNTNGETYKTSDSEKIDEFLKLMKDVKFSKQSNQSPSVGWSYYIRLTHADELTGFGVSLPRVYFVTYSSISGSDSIRSPYYSIENSDEALRKIDEFFNSLKQNK